VAKIRAACGASSANVLQKKNLGDEIYYQQRLIRAPVREGVLLPPVALEAK